MAQLICCLEGFSGGPRTKHHLIESFIQHSSQLDMRRINKVGAKACLTPRLSYNACYICGMTASSLLCRTLSQGAEIANYPLPGEPFKFACLSPLKLYLAGKLNRLSGARCSYIAQSNQTPFSYDESRIANGTFVRRIRVIHGLS